MRVASKHTTMQLFVRTDRTLSLQADACSTVASLKTQLRQRAGELVQFRELRMVPSR